MKRRAKSFAVEEEYYNELSEIFKSNFVDISISNCINRYIKEFLEYLKTIIREIEKDQSITIPIAFIVETVGREPIFKIFDSELSIQEEVKELQKKYNTHIKKNPEKIKEYDIENLNDELQFTKLIQLLLKVVWEEKKMGRETTDDEYTELARQIGGKDFLKALRVKVRPIALKLDKYDPDLRDVFERIATKLSKKQGG